MKIEVFASADAAADAAAKTLIAALSGAGPRRLVVTGGRTAGPVYDRLASSALDWREITVTLSDDRFVGADSPDSNEKLVRERLLQGKAAVARFVPLRGDGRTPADDAAAAEPKIRPLLPFDAVLLGMGEDGHIASLFPNGPDIAAPLDPEGDQLVVGVEHPGLAPYLPRISLTGAALFASRLIVVLTSGEAKRALLERALRDAAFAPPISMVLRQQRAPVRLLWSPGA